MGILFTLAIVVTMGAIGWKRLQRSRLQHRTRLEEDTAPTVILTHAEIDDHLRCTCGGRRIKDGEGPKGESWRVLVHCGSCGRRRALLFKLAS